MGFFSILGVCLLYICSHFYSHYFSLSLWHMVCSISWVACREMQYFVTSCNTLSPPFCCFWWSYMNKWTLACLYFLESLFYVLLSEIVVWSIFVKIVLLLRSIRGQVQRCRRKNSIFSSLCYAQAPYLATEPSKHPDVVSPTFTYWKSPNLCPYHDSSIFGGFLYSSR